MTKKHIEQADDVVTDLAPLVSGFLRANPDFFVQHQDLLAVLTIPHESGVAVSLLERQVQILRDRHRHLHNKYQEFLNNARDSELLSQHLHTLTVQLLNARDVADVVHIIHECLLSDFKAEFVTLRLFADAPADSLHTSDLVFAGSECSERAMFDKLFALGRPECGRLEPGQQQFIFATDAAAVGSAVLVPLVGARFQGLLAVASRDARRYYAGMGVDLMLHLGDITCLALNPFLARSTS